MKQIAPSSGVPGPFGGDPTPPGDGLAKVLSLPVHRSIFAVDIERSTRRPNPIKEELRDELYHMIGEALDTSGIDPEDCDELVDRGDGVLVLIHPVDRVPKPLLLSRLVPQLHELVLGHNKRLPKADRQMRALRLRAVLHAGEVHHDRRGPFGDSLDEAFRLLDARCVKTCLLDSDGPVVLVVSEYLHREIVRHSYNGIDGSGFTKFSVDVGGRRRRGWLRRLGAIRRQRVVGRQ